MSRAREALAFVRASWSALNVIKEQQELLGLPVDVRLVAQLHAAELAIDYWGEVVERQERKALPS